MVADELEGGEFIRAGGFFDGAAERGELAFDFVSREQMQSCGEDRGFEDSVFRAIESEEVSQAADVNDSCADVCAVVRCVERLDFELVPTTGGGEDSAADFFGGERFGQRVELSDRGLRQQQDVIDDVEDPVWLLLQVAKGLRRLKRTQMQPRQRLIDDRPHRGDVEFAGGVQAGDNAFENHVQIVAGSDCLPSVIGSVEIECCRLCVVLAESPLMKRCLGEVLMWLLVIFASSPVLADESPPKGEPEQFPQSAKLTRDRRAETVLETARAQLRQQDFAAAIVALQELLDGPNAFLGSAASVPSSVEEANRLLREMPAAAREAYERLHGAEANRLWLAAQQSGRADGLREVVARFGATTAGWRALRDLAARHVDRGEWQLAATASMKLAGHPHSSVTKETSWIARWVLAESHLPDRDSSNRDSSARKLLQQYRSLLERSPVPTGASGNNLAEWIEKQWPAADPAGRPFAAREANDWRAALSLAPSGHNVFQFDAELNGEPANWLQEILAEWARYDVATLPSTQPLVVGDVVIARFVHPAKVVAVDTKRGKLLWEQSLVGALGSTATDLQRHPGIRTPLVEELQRRWFGDSVRGQMTSDGRRLFLVRDLDDLDLKPGAGSRLRNHLEAWDLATGERRWRIGSSVNEPPTGFEGLYFLGPPLASDGLLYVIAQRELQVALWVLRASDGQLEWTLPLAETDRLQFRDPGWRHVACPVTWAGGRLICPTGAGCFVAVDPIARSLAWSVRFERDDIAAVAGFLGTDRDRPFASRWWESWREVESRETRVERREEGNSNSRLSALNSRLLIASPESRSLRAVHVQTGEILWRTKFDEPLFLAANDSAVLVFERTRVVGIDPANGRERWQSPLSAPDGTGEWVGTSYVCPTGGCWSMIDSDTGQVRRSEDGFWWHFDLDVDRKKVAPSKPFIPDTGRLVRVGSRWVVLSPGQLAVFDSIAARQSDVAKRAESKPNDADARIELALHAQQFGDFDKAEEFVRPLLKEADATPKATWALREILMRRLSAQPAEHSHLADELLRLSSSERPHEEARHALIVAARKSDDLVAGMRQVVGLLGKVPEADVNVGHVFNVPGKNTTQEHVENVLHVRNERWVQGVIADLMSQADEATRPTLTALLEEFRQRAFDSPDAFASQRLSERLGCLPLGRELRMQLSGRTGSGVGYLKTSLALREIAQGSDRTEAAQAWHRLALLHDFRSEPLDAADCYRELRDGFADVKLPNGHSSAEWLADVMPESPIGRALADGPCDPWPLRLPKVTSQEEHHDDVYCYQIAVESRDPYWRRMSVFVDRQGKKVRFTGGGQRGLWELPLPAANSPFRHDWRTHRGWGLGPLLVLQVGDGLYGIQPLDERGETNAKVLWTISTGPYDESGPNQMLPGRLGVRWDAIRHLDRYEQPVLDVVHASAGLLCYRTRNRLNAIDPVNGQWLWSRHRLPPQVSVSGDGERIVLRLLATHEIEVRRGFDGRLLSRRGDDSDPNGMLIEQGRLRLSSSLNKSGEAASAMKLHCQDVVTGETLWQRDVPSGSVVLRVDDSRFGVVEPAGMLRFLSLTDREELSKQEVSLPKSLSTAHVLGDDQRLFVILSGPVTETSWLATQQDRGGFRRPMLNGWVHAFDRRSLKSLWTIPAKNLPFAIDQPNDLPFFVLPYLRPSDDSTDGQHSDGVLHLIDKRTGQEVLYDIGGLNNVYFALEPDALQQRVEILTTKRRIRLDHVGN